MKFVVCVVRDVRAAVFGNPFFLASLGQAERQFADEVNRAAEDNVMYKHPEDFELFNLGTFDSLTATFVLLERPLQIAEGRSMVSQKRGDRAQMALVS